MKKVAIIGTHGVGKTSLVHLLMGSFIAIHKPVGAVLEAVEELSRTDPTFKKDEGTNLESQARILEYHFHREIEAKQSNRFSVLICDRAIDNYAYMQRACGEQPKYRQLVLDHLKNHPYTLIVKVPITANGITDNQFRDTGLEFQHDIDRRIDEFLAQHKIPHLVLPDPVDPIRMDWVYRVIKHLGYKVELKDTSQHN